MRHLALAGFLAGALVAPGWGQPALGVDPPTGEETSVRPIPIPAPARALSQSLATPLAELTAEVLERNPDLARARREAVAAELRAPQVSALPDPMATLAPFLSSPETRVGPQQLTAGISQRFPWFGKLALRERAALFVATAAAADVEARALSLVTETRRMYYELAFLAAQETEIRKDRATLEHYEELARARYASGVGLEQAVVKIQAEITKDDNRLLDLATRRAALVASLNALRDREQDASPPEVKLPEELPVPPIVVEALRETALARRPEVTRARARLAESATSVELAKRQYFPDVTLGLNYTLVGKRDDAAGRSMPPEGNGDDVVALTAGVNLPVRRKSLEAGVEEAAQRELAAEEALRSVVAEIERSLGDLTQRIPLTFDQYRLFGDVLTIQAEEALRSAEAAYGAGALGALDLLDAERVLLDVRIGAARTLADLAIAIARLEGAVARPLGLVIPDTINETSGASAAPTARSETSDGESS